MNNPQRNPSIYDTVIRFMILFLIIVWCLLIMFPFKHIIVWSLVLAVALFPLHNSLSKKMGGRTKLASVMIILFFLVILIVPATLLTIGLVEEIKELKQKQGKSIWCIGGGELIALLLNHALLDEVRVFIMPVILGVRRSPGSGT